MQVGFKENDVVYTPYGYGVLASIGPREYIEPKEEVVQPSTEPERSDSGDKGRTDEEFEIRMRRARDQQARAEAVATSNEGAIAQPSTTTVILATVNLKWGGIVHLEERLLTKKIKFSVKTFFGTRKRFDFELDISTTVTQLKQLITEAAGEYSKSICNLRLLYPMGAVTELNVGGNSLEAYRIPDGANLLLLVQTIFAWDPSHKGSGIKLSNNNLTANKNGDVDYQTALGSVGFSSGRHYWELKIDKFVDEEDLFVGVARRNINLNMRPNDTKNFWGYMPLCGKKISPDGELLDYGFSCKTQDIVGVLLEFKQGIGTLSFYKNGAKCGTAYSNLTGTLHPAISMYYLSLIHI
eukprot:TRINITY_DN2971_c0_g2_i13.p1 TRINITY_DN2971_c0_g2~~TRINITY_DN2971_c0_g2_i13.p1  ORF type:complete len:353 (-),score=65.49 TRINITY_DN2971_c0_g2_i13:1-1059(-)